MITRAETAYERLSKLTKGLDVTVPLCLSTVCNLLDGTISPQSKQTLVEWLKEYLEQFPKGL